MTSTETRNTLDEATPAVRGVLSALYAAWAAGDADAFAALYREDATVVMPGVFHRGREQVREYMAAAFAGPLRGSRGIDEPADFRLVGPDTAIVVSTAGILLSGEEHLPVDRERRATWVLQRADDRWLIAAYSNAPAH